MPSCPPLRGLQNLLRPTSIRMARHQELFKATTTHSPMTLTAIQNCRHVSIADRSLPWRRLHKGTGKTELIRAGRSWRREEKRSPRRRGARAGASPISLPLSDGDVRGHGGNHPSRATYYALERKVNK